jgi:hypothetical protein
METKIGKVVNDHVLISKFWELKYKNSNMHGCGLIACSHIALQGLIDSMF